MDAINLVRPASAPPVGAVDTQAPNLRVYWARHLDDVQAAQRLRYAVFAQEMGAKIPHEPGGTAGLDVDSFDAHCEHLIVTTAPTSDDSPEVVGTYRVLLPQAAVRAGGYYTESEFDLEALAALRPHMAELGRSCIAAPWRTGGVIMMLWSHLVRFLLANGARHAIGCASVPMADGGRTATRLWREIEQQHLSSPTHRVRPHVALPVDQLDSQGPAEWPPLVKGYLRCGAKVMGPPAWDPDFGTADLPMLLDFEKMPASYRKRFAGT